MTKRYINVAYKDREMAKRLGARWDASVRRWYCPPGSALAKVYSWRKSSGGSALDLPVAAMGVRAPSATGGHTSSDQLSLLG
ncbi:DUF5710 domain-containing protein [uncultured Algimonas sp.]|uniref:DUF5710 domain-containing protein n=1 Tax=uncultured Algimonas sp. TaxID=1547920 RepID=UPI002604108F|nr:DUF5710 domain-containing protein [uncultured Algimonas sp.]